MSDITPDALRALAERPYLGNPAPDRAVFALCDALRAAADRIEALEDENAEAVALLREVVKMNWTLSNATASAALDELARKASILLARQEAEG